MVENNKSPKTEIGGIDKEMITIHHQCDLSKIPFKIGVLHASQIIANENVTIKDTTIPPTKPSHVFLGEIRGFILCFPNKIPKK